MDELRAFLERLGLVQYLEVLAENDVDLESLPHLSDQDLKELGLSLGHRRKLMAALAAEPPTPEEGHAAPLQTGAESGLTEDADRRQLTVLFCDLIGSTALSQKLDPEDLRDLMRRYHDAVANAVAAYGGHVAKLLGDGVLAYFGWPQANEAQSEMAVRGALAAAQAVEEITVGENRLAARAGIATGPVVVGDMTGETAREAGAVVGVTPNLAARLQEQAEPGGVAIDEATRKLVGASFALEDAGEQALKGFDQPVRIWRVQGALQTGSRFEAQHLGGLTAFVGRAHELGLLNDRWEQARDGDGQVVLVAGEAGIGKSRILREFSANLGEERVLRLQCSPHETNAAFHPVIHEIEASAGFETGDGPDLRLDKLESHLGGMFADGREALPLFAALLGLPTERYPALELSPQRRKLLTLDLVAERFALLAAARPLALFFEDIHWIDPSSLEALDGLIERVQSLPILLVMTHRPEFPLRWNEFGHVTLHSLNRLGRGGGRAIAERVAGGKPLPEDLLERIVAQTDGIPLFVEELTKTVLETGILEEKDGVYLLKGPLPELVIPATLQDSLMARLDRLAPVKKVVQAAACIGREFDRSLLKHALGMDDDALTHALEELVKAQLIYRRGGMGSSRYIFKHALVQDAAYASLLTGTRRQLHAAIAKTLEGQADPDPLELGRHCLEAGERQKAAGCYLAAGRRALGESALPEATSALETGLAALQPLEGSQARDRLELDLRVALGTARMARFGWAHPSLAEALEPAYGLARSFGDEDALASILWGLWVHYQTRTDFPRAHEWLAALKSVAEERPESDLPVVYDMSAGCQYFWEARHERAIKHTDRLRAQYERKRHARLAKLTNHDPLVFAQHWAGSLADWIRGRPEDSLERMEEAIALARDIGHPFNLVFALTAGASSLIYLNEAERLLKHCREAETVVEEEALGPFSLKVNVMQWRGGALIRKGDYEHGTAEAKAGNEFWNESGGRICNAMFRGWIVSGLQGLGLIDEALEVNAATIAHCRETGDCYMEPECLRQRGELLLGAEAATLAKQNETPEGLFREALRLAQKQGALSWGLRAATSLAELLESEDRMAEARACLEPALQALQQGLKTHDPLRAARLLERLA